MAKINSDESVVENFSIDNQVGYLLRCAFQKANGFTADRIRPYDLTNVQFSTMARLLEHGPLSQNQLGRLVTMPPANIHSLVGRLKKQGLVNTDRDPADKRLILISLSTKGRNLVKKLIPLDLQSAGDALASLNKSEQKVFLKLLKKMV